MSQRHISYPKVTIMEEEIEVVSNQHAADGKYHMLQLLSAVI